MSPKPALVRVLRLAAAYNVAWGVWQIASPRSYLSLLGAEPLNYTMIWQGLGLFVALYGCLYFLASFNYIRHWPIIAVGAASKLLGCAGFIYCVLNGSLPASFAYATIPNDLIWLLPFSAMLKQARASGFTLR